MSSIYFIYIVSTVISLIRYRETMLLEADWKSLSQNICTKLKATHFQLFLLRVNFALTLSFTVLATHQTALMDRLGMYQV